MAIAALKDAHTIRAIDTADGDLRNAAYAASVLDGIDAILHFAPISLTLGTDEDNLDLAARSTYHLAYTAAQKGLSRMGSTAEIAWPSWPRLVTSGRFWILQLSIAEPLPCQSMKPLAPNK